VVITSGITGKKKVCTSPLSGLSKGGVEAGTSCPCCGSGGGGEKGKEGTFVVPAPVTKRGGGKERRAHATRVERACGRLFASVTLGGQEEKRGASDPMHRRLRRSRVASNLPPHYGEGGKDGSIEPSIGEGRSDLLVALTSKELKS